MELLSQSCPKQRSAKRGTAWYLDKGADNFLVCTRQPLQLSIFSCKLLDSIAAVKHPSDGEHDRFQSRE